MEDRWLFEYLGSCLSVDGGPPNDLNVGVANGLAKRM